MPEIDPIMEKASEALAKMQYLDCESLCLQALKIARDAKQWSVYSRILLPLQEARRQRRMIAADGAVRLGLASFSGSAEDLLGEQKDACIVVTSPHDKDFALALRNEARKQQRYVEVLFADMTDADKGWQIASVAGPSVCTFMPAPCEDKVDSWLVGSDKQRGAFSAADWFVDATEALGDAALNSVDPDLVGEEKIAALEQCLEAVTDHEILHQRLADAARELV